MNRFLQSVSNPHVYAAGDVAATNGPALTPISGYEGRIAAANLLNGNTEQPNYSGFASVVFTIPPLAMTGLTEDAAHAAENRFRTASRGDHRLVFVPPRGRRVQRVQSPGGAGLGPDCRSTPAGRRGG